MLNVLVPSRSLPQKESVRTRLGVNGPKRVCRVQNLR